MISNTEIILISISGSDKPGLTSSLTQILASHQAIILDIGQADIHHNLSLGILIRTTSDNSGAIMKELLFKAYELEIHIRFKPITVDEYNDWVKRQGKNRYIITLLGRQLTADQIAQVTHTLAMQKLNIDAIQRLTGRPNLLQNSAKGKSCVQLSVRGNPIDIEGMKEVFVRLSTELGFDISFQEDNIYRRSRRLICFDMDSTLIQTEVIDELAERAGVGNEVKAITESAMRGEIDFNESFIKRISLLKGLHCSVMEEVAQSLPYTEGLELMMRVLKNMGFKTAILSGGFTYFGNKLKEQLGFDYVYANELEIDENGYLTGKHLGNIVDGSRKAELLQFLAHKEQVDIQQTVAVGDGANDLPMLSIAGLGIAFHAKPTVKETAKQSISTIGLEGVLYFLGFKDSYLGLFH